MRMNHLSRREWLWAAGGGLGGIALTSMLAAEETARPSPQFNGGLHHPAKARRVIQLFMNGGLSQMDTFDRKPELDRRHGQKFDPGEHVEAVTSTPGNVMKCPFRFRQYGQCGRSVSDVFPHLARQVDDLAFLMNIAVRTNVHGPASYKMNTGFILPGFPCMGAWLSYGLGRMTDDLPTFVVIPDQRGFPYNNLGNFTSGFLPAVHAGTILRVGVPEPIAALHPPTSARYITPDSEREGQSVLEKLNRQHLADHPDDSRLEARISSYELAARLQVRAPEAMDLARETEETRRLYGIGQPECDAFARSCLTARRLVERGVRFVQVWSGAGGPSNNWDNHTSIINELPPIARSVDQPTAALLMDLKRRGMMEDTLVIFSSEFGRHPFTQGAEGRDHNGGTSLAWLAGAGVKGGTSVGQSDEWSWRALDSHTPHDLHATILHLLGIDHERLTFLHNGANRRLTDVHGHVVEDMLA